METSTVFTLLLITAVVFLGIGLIGGMFITQNNQAKAAKFAEELKKEYDEHLAEWKKAFKEWKDKD